MNPLTLVKRIQQINSREAALNISEDASWHTKYKDSAYVFVGGIPFDFTEGDVIAVFAQYGEVVDINLVRDKGTGKSKGFAFLAYEDQRSTNLAVDNLNGAQVSGRIIRVDHVDKYKKMEEEDEEEAKQKREARGVCRAFQRGECTRGAGCKFSHDEQRAANTGWGDNGIAKGDNDKYDGPNKERRYGNNKPDRIPETRDRDSRFRARENEMELDYPSKRNDRREEKMLRRQDGDSKFVGRENTSRREEKRPRDYQDDEFEQLPREDRQRREEMRSRNGYDDREPEPRDHKREDRRSIKQDDVEFEPKSRDSDHREDKRPSRRDVDDFGSKSRVSDLREDKRPSRRDVDDFGSKSRETHGSREERRSRKHTDDESMPRSREDHDRKQDNRSYQKDTDRSESKGRNDSDQREEKRSRR